MRIRLVAARLVRRRCRRASGSGGWGVDRWKSRRTLRQRACAGRARWVTHAWRDVRRTRAQVDDGVRTGVCGWFFADAASRRSFGRRVALTQSSVSHQATVASRSSQGAVPQRAVPSPEYCLVIPRSDSDEGSYLRYSWPATRVAREIPPCRLGRPGAARMTWCAVGRGRGHGAPLPPSPVGRAGRLLTRTAHSYCSLVLLTHTGDCCLMTD